MKKWQVFLLDGKTITVEADYCTGTCVQKSGALSVETLPFMDIRFRNEGDGLLVARHRFYGTGFREVG